MSWYVIQESWMTESTECMWTPFTNLPMVCLSLVPSLSFPPCTVVYHIHASQSSKSFLSASLLLLFVVVYDGLTWAWHTSCADCQFYRDSQRVNYTKFSIRSTKKKKHTCIVGKSQTSILILNQSYYLDCESLLWIKKTNKQLVILNLKKKTLNILIYLFYMVQWDMWTTRLPKQKRKKNILKLKSISNLTKIIKMWIGETVRKLTEHRFDFIKFERHKRQALSIKYFMNSSYLCVDWVGFLVHFYCQ